MAIKDYSTTPDLNTQISGINIAEGCAPSGINNAIRQFMADVKAEKDALDAEQAAKDAKQAAKDAEQDAAITASQTAADTANAGLEGVVRSVNGVAADAAGNVSDATWSNSNSVIRFSNGLQIVKTIYAITTSSTTYAITFPVAFSSAPIVIPALSSKDLVSTHSLTTSGFKIDVNTLVGNALLYIAVGQWK